MSAYLILSCEHGGNDVPPDLHDLFVGAEAELEGHAGWDPGALELAVTLAADHAAPLVACRTSRLVVDTNRSEAAPDVFSARTRDLPLSRREELLARWHRPHRAAVEDLVDLALDRGRRALHLSVHTFTPTLAGRPRDVDIGVLFDPSRLGEATAARAWLAGLRRSAPDLRCRENEPYLGVDDGLTSTLRARWKAGRYVGLEVEVSQALLRVEAERRQIQAHVSGSLRAILPRFAP